jgi:hypothetical protein
VCSSDLSKTRCGVDSPASDDGFGRTTWRVLQRWQINRLVKLTGLLVEANDFTAEITSLLRLFNNSSRKAKDIFSDERTLFSLTKHHLPERVN